MDGYKKKINEIHAPEDLIKSTLSKIQEEEKKQQAVNGEANTMLQEKTSEQKKEGRKRSRVGVAALATIAAAIVLVIGLSRGNQPQLNLKYNTMPETIVRAVIGEHTESNMSLEEYSAYLGMDIENLIENATLIKTKIYVVYEENAIVEDEGTAFYNVDGEQMMIRFSKTGNTMPETLREGEASQVDGRMVWAGVSENGKERMAAFEDKGISYFLMSYSMEQQEFEEFLTEFLKSLKEN